MALSSDNKKKLHRERFEKRTIECMIRIFCEYHHENPVCEECKELLSYAYARIEKCPLIPDKPTCKNCTIHCYDKKHRERIRAVMKFSGPRMFTRHPFLSLIYLKNKFLDSRRKKQKN